MIANNSEATAREIVITRMFDAPRALVFAAWTDPAHMAQWWGPKGFTIPVCELDVRPGGAILIHMRGPDGTLYPGGGMFHEIIAPERLVFTTTAFENAAGKPGLEVLNTVTFTEQHGRTELRLHAVVVTAAPESIEALAGMEQGWSQSLDKLAEHMSAG